jgi:hypothetical protein
MVVVDDDVGTVLAEVVALSVTHESKALQLTAPSAREKRGKTAKVVDRILKDEERSRREKLDRR